MNRRIAPLKQLQRAARPAALLLAGLFLSRCAPAQTPTRSSPLGIIVQSKTSHEPKFIPWESEESVHTALEALRKDGGGTISFLPGEYVIRKGFTLFGLSDVTIRGTENVLLRFAKSPKFMPKLTRAAKEGDEYLMVDHAELLRVGWKYQVYKQDLKGDRLLEFRVLEVEEGRVKIAPRVRFMGHVGAIPKESGVLAHLNFFNITQCDSVSLVGLRMDGIQRGRVHGHTTFCGVLSVGQYKAGERPKNHGLAIRNCTFLNLKGRGVAVYGMGDTLVEGSHFSGIDSQAIEIDHFSSGTIRFNEVHDSGVGIALNDAFESKVFGNTIRKCKSAISFVKHFAHEWVNQGNLVEGNLIIDAMQTGISFLQPMAGNTIRGNLFKDTEKSKWVVNAAGNTVSGSVAID